MKTQILTNLEEIKNRIKSACKKANRSPSEITLLPVTKTQSIDVIKEAFAGGLSRFGENKIQEAKEKSESLSNLPIDWCIIGHLQSNKVKYVARFASELHSLDRLKLAKKLEEHLQSEGRSINVLIQINSSNEAQKCGLHPSEALNFAKELTAFSSLKVKGLMTLALFSVDETKVRSCFRRMYQLRERLRQDGPDISSWNVLSMGMSGDLEIAIEEGATEVRIGKAIFGTRHLPNSYYWPGL